MGRLALVALLLAYLPGAVLFRLPYGQRAARARLAADERAFWAVMLSVTWSVALVMAMAAFGAYTFSRLLWTNVLLAGSAAVIWRGRLRYRGDAVRPTAAALLPIALIVFAGWLYWPAADYVMGGKDPGTYINEGAALARAGGLSVHDADVAAVPERVRDLFFPEYHGAPYYSLRFMGFFVMDPDRGIVMGQFPHWLPASIAIGQGVAGLSGMRNTIIAWALLGLLAVYFAGAQAFGRLAATLAAGLLAINVAEVWFARYPNSELPMQALLFAALLAFRRATEGSRGFFGTIAGTLIALALLSRYDAILAVAAFAVAARLLTVSRERIGWPFAVAAGVLGAIAFWYLAVPMKPYSDWYVAFTLREGWWLVPAGLVAAAGFHAVARQPVPAAFLARWIPAVFGLTVLGLSLYAYFFRFQHGLLAAFDADAFRHFAWYVTRPGLLAAVLATAWLGWRRFWQIPALVLLVAVFDVFFFYKTRIVPDHFWAARRYIAVTIPGVTLFVAAMATHVCSRDRLARLLPGLGAAGRRAAAPLAAGALAVLAVAPLAAAFWHQTAAIASHVEYAGLSGQLESIVARVGPNDLLIVESREADSDLHVLALPMAYVYGRHVLVLSSAKPDKRKLEAFVAWARTRFDRTLFLGSGGTDLLTRRIAAVPLESRRFQIPEYASTRDAYPIGVRRKEFDFGLYRLVPASDAAPGPVDLPIGVLDDLNVVRFYAKEQHDRTGELFRWTKRNATVMLLGVSPDATTVTVWMGSGGRPPSAPPADVTVSFAGQTIGHATPVDEVRGYAFSLPPDLVRAAAASLDPVPLTIDVPLWSPHDVLGASDTRMLGVMVTRVGVR